MSLHTLSTGVSALQPQPVVMGKVSLALKDDFFKNN